MPPYGVVSTTHSDSPQIMPNVLTMIFYNMIVIILPFSLTTEGAAAAAANCSWIAELLCPLTN